MLERTTRQNKNAYTREKNAEKKKDSLLFTYTTNIYKSLDSSSFSNILLSSYLPTHFVSKVYTYIKECVCVFFSMKSKYFLPADVSNTCIKVIERV